MEILLVMLCFTSSVFAQDRPKVRVIYPKKTEINLSGTEIRGELKNPGELYFLRRTPEKFDSLIKRRKDFHREMLRDVVMTP